MKKLNLQIMVLYNFIQLGKDPDPDPPDLDPEKRSGSNQIRIRNPGLF